MKPPSVGTVKSRGIPAIQITFSPGTQECRVEVRGVEWQVGEPASI